MKTKVERLVTAIGEDENISQIVIFLYNEDEILKQFQVETV